MKMTTRILTTRAVKKELLATTMLTTLAMSPVSLALAQTAPVQELPTVELTATGQAAQTQPAPEQAPPQKPFSQPLPENIPAVVETVTADEIRQDINAVTSTDTLKYLPSIDLRTRYEGEQNPMIGFRTTSQDTPAQSLIYADGILLSNLLGNYYYYPPVTQMVTPNEISRVDVIYGPFSALYPGNSYGGIVTFSTRMLISSRPTWRRSGLRSILIFMIATVDNFSLAIGDRYNAFSFWLTYDHVTSDSQPLEYANFSPTAPYYGIQGLAVGGGVPYTFPCVKVVPGTSCGSGVVLGPDNNYTGQQDLGKLKLAMISRQRCV
jgi:iron complex outermembrane recepter protein